MFGKGSTTSAHSSQALSALDSLAQASPRHVPRAATPQHTPWADTGSLSPACTHFWRARPNQAAVAAAHGQQCHRAGGQESLEGGLVGPRSSKGGHYAPLPVVPPYRANLQRAGREALCGAVTMEQLQPAAHGFASSSRHLPGLQTGRQTHVQAAKHASSSHTCKQLHKKTPTCAHCRTRLPRPSAPTSSRACRLPPPSRFSCTNGPPSSCSRQEGAPVRRGCLQACESVQVGS